MDAPQNSAWLEVFGEDGDIQRVELPPSTPMLIGRCPDSRVDCRYDRTVSRRHCQIDFAPPQCWLTNLSPNGTRVNGMEVAEYCLAEGDRVSLGSSVEFQVHLPVSRADEQSSARNLRTLGSSPRLSLDGAFVSRGTGPDEISMISEAFRDVKKPAAVEMLPVIRAVGQVMDVLQRSMTSADFFQRAARAVVELVGMDTGRILLRTDRGWEERVIEVSSRVHPADVIPFSRSIADLVRVHRQVFWENGMSADGSSSSIAQLDAVVGAPIFDEEGNVIGAVYGDRRQTDIDTDEVSEWEAMLIELLACTVASGLLRVRQQEQVASQRRQFEQFFTRTLAEQLEKDPTLLEGRDALVTTLFCDVRKFSAISEKLGTTKTFEWINDVMDVLSECVRDFDGVLVDYIGDELMAMWGAPGVQPDHAQRACLAAMNMLERLPDIDKRWEARVGVKTKVGVGINTGPVRVGNTGSRIKFKYGPLGHAVNLASRVQGATKYLMSPMLITESTRQLLGDDFTGRRLCSIQVVNINEPVNIYELRSVNYEEHSRIVVPYNEALGAFESGDFRRTATLLTHILNQFPDDGPSLLLLSRAVGAMTSSDEFSPVWELPGK